jgi:hypothetical protein
LAIVVKSFQVVERPLLRFPSPFVPQPPSLIVSNSIPLPPDADIAPQVHVPIAVPVPFQERQGLTQTGEPLQAICVDSIHPTIKDETHRSLSPSPGVQSSLLGSEKEEQEQQTRESRGKAEAKSDSALPAFLPEAVPRPQKTYADTVGLPRKPYRTRAVRPPSLSLENEHPSSPLSAIAEQEEGEEDDEEEEEIERRKRNLHLPKRTTLASYLFWNCSKCKQENPHNSKLCISCQEHAPDRKPTLKVQQKGERQTKEKKLDITKELENTDEVVRKANLKYLEHYNQERKSRDVSVGLNSNPNRETPFKLRKNTEFNKNIHRITKWICGQCQHTNVIREGEVLDTACKQCRKNTYHRAIQNRHVRTEDTS